MAISLALLLLSTTGLLLTGLVGYSYYHRSVPGAPALAGLALAIAIWVLAYALELGASSYATKLLSARLQYIGIVGTPPAWMLFARRYAGDRLWPLRRFGWLLLLIPIVTLALVWTNELHLLIWRRIDYTASEPFPTLKVSYGPWFWVHATYSYALMALGSRSLLRLLGRAASLFRARIVAVLMCALTPWLGNAVYIFRIDPLYPLDPTPFAFSVSAFMLGWMLFRADLLDIVPVARSAIFQSMRDAVIVVDPQRRVIDLNLIARQITGQAARAAIGQPLEHVLAGLDGQLEQSSGAADARSEIAIGAQIYEAQINPLHDNRGWIITLHDITERTRAEQHQRLLADTSALLATTLAPKEALVTVAELTVPRLADWCMIHVQEDDGALRLVALNFADARKQSLADELKRNYPLDPNAPHSYPLVLRTGRSELIPEVTDAGLATIAHDERHLELLRALAFRSTISVPLIARGRTIGTILLGAAESGRRYDQADLRLAEELAIRVALAIDNANLFANLQLSEQRYRTLIARAADSILLAAADGAIIDANQQVSQLLGYAHAELLELRLADLLEPPGVHDSAALLSALRGSEHALQMRCKDGTACPIEMSVGMVTQKQQASYILIIRDMTERKRAENQLRRKNDELAALYDTTLGLINHLNIGTMLASVVRRAGSLLDTPHGYLYVYDSDADELVVRVANGVFAPYIGARVVRGEGLAGQVWVSGRPSAVENYAAWESRLRELDELKLHALVCVPIYAGAQFVGVLGLAHREPARVFSPDEIALLERFANMASLALENARLYTATQQELDERRRAEQALLRTEAELRAAKEAAEAATQAKSAFLAQMSHEIRAPMTNVLGASYLLKQGSLDAQQHELTEIISTSGNALLAIINDILDLSKIQSGHMQLDRTIFSLQECVEAAISLIAVAATNKHIEVAYSIDQQVPDRIVGDLPRLRQILVNLLNNAIKFTHAGDVLVGITATPGAAATHELHITVADTGIGIPAEYLGRLFDSFSQADSSIPRIYGGTGLGLTISKHLTELMGGRMWAESQVGAGSTFHFTISAASAAQAAPSPARWLASRRLLVVNEYPRSRQALAQQARDWGMRVSDTGSPYEALAWLRRGDAFDAALVDLSFRNDGLHSSMLIDELRRTRTPQELPVLLLAPLDFPNDELAAIGAYVQQILRKPFKHTQIERALHNLLHRSSSAQSPAAAAPAADPALQLLVVDDDTTNRSLNQYLAQQIGHRATPASSGAAALEALDCERYDVVLLDIHMHGMDGIEVARHIHERCGAERPYLIAVTAESLPDGRERYLLAGFDDYLLKPIWPAALEQALERFRAARAPLGLELGGAPSQARPGAARIDIQSFPSEFVDSYLADAAALIERMRAASAHNDARALRRASHQLKSSSAIVGAEQLAELCSALEQASSTAPSAWPAQIEAIAAEFARVQQALGQAGA